MKSEADDRGMFGPYGGRFVPEMLISALDELVEEKGFDGKVGWQLAGELLRLEDRNELELSREDAILHWYFDTEERGIQVTLARPRKEDSDGNVATLDGIHWEGGTIATSPKTMWFDRSTGLLREEVVEEKSLST